MTESSASLPSQSTPTSAEKLLTPVQYVRAVGPQRAELLKNLGITTAQDLLFHVPHAVNDFSDLRPVEKLEKDIEQSVHGYVVDRDARELSKGRSLVGILLNCDGHFVRGTWFNQPWMFKKFRDNEHVVFSGKPQRKAGRWEFNGPRFHIMAPDDDIEAAAGVLPRYALTDGIKMDAMRRMIRAVVEDFAALVSDPIPEAYREHHRLPALSTALRWLHLPESVKQWQAGRYRILLDDLFEFQLGLALRRRTWGRTLRADAIEVTAKVDARIRRLFSFRFTEGQDRSIREITGDILQPHPMHRLLQADVGAGKTAVAVYAMLSAIAAGKQAVLMAPTEVLATQHWETFEELLSESRVQRGLLLGGLPAAKRRELLEGISSGTTQLIIGTQAVIQESVKFKNLSLVVIDEQHRFGVRQRASFTTQSTSPHVLVMTATPIPRSLCLTQFGDLDVSVIRELPPGRQKVVTARILDQPEQARMWLFVKQQIAKGRQAYVVCPRVEEKNEEDFSSAEAVFRNLSATELAGLRVDLLHGRMDREQRHAVMDRFRNHETDVLISTTVIEVGVNIPNATIMIIQEADRFGLAQLHQLRGRICRGSHQGYCFLLSLTELPEAIERLTALEKSSDGFELAEKDAELRGPGDILGLRQSGAMPLRVADPVRDLSILQAARRMAQDLVDEGRFDQPEFSALRTIVLSRFANLLDLPQTG
ncbi:MAG: ATP-dependent DNA helicase RecG [Planctomycetales bacterium]|jgi:ATP-dependent DNA helicase RecG|nr:ATP-dependent DNA helicase RecG [Planctomycetales bacterium]